MNTENSNTDILHHAKEYYQFRDCMIKVVTKEGHFRAVILKASDIVESARTRHELNPLATTEKFLNNILRRNTGVVGAGNPERDVALHIVPVGEIREIVVFEVSVIFCRGWSRPPPTKISTNSI